MSAPQKPLQADVVIIGAGPTGLTAAYELHHAGRQTIVLEKLHTVGGIARTENYKGYHVDIGGHRFYTKIKPVARLWRQLLGNDFLHRQRLSRIYYNNRFFYYPIRLPDVLTKLGLQEVVRVIGSYLWAQWQPYQQENSLQEWVSNRFGRRLFEIFFKSYTEKVWGIPADKIKAEWAAQRIKDLSLSSAIRNALQNSNQIKTLIETFDYPRRGPGMLWERMQQQLEAAGQQIMLQAEVVAVHRVGQRITAVEVQTPHGRITVRGAAFLSSMPLRELILKLTPPPPPEILTAAERLSYRDFLTVALIVRRAELFADNWIYVHSPEVQVGRIQNFKNWSPEMIPQRAAHTSCLGLEYFCNQGDPLWQKSDAALIALGTAEVAQLGLVNPSEVIDGVVYRQPKAYPVYSGEYGIYLALLKQYLNSFSNLQTAGRNGLHKYNNQDHSMLTAMLAVRNILGADYDVWAVNTERSYYEEIKIPKA